MGDTTEEPILTKRFDRAVKYATSVHRRDLRKSTEIPYLSHLLGVCSSVLENCGNEDEAIAALLHDAAEDHGGRKQLKKISERFGPEVAQIVEECSDSILPKGAKKADWLPRKEAYIERLVAHALDRPGTLLVSAADKLYNLRSIYADTQRPGTGQSVFERFSGKKWGTLWYYRRLADAYLSVPGRHATIAMELATLIEAMSEGRDAATLLELHKRLEPGKRSEGITPA